MTTQIRRNYIKDFNLESVNNLVNFANDKGYYVEQFEGSLLDNYIIYNTESIRIGTIKPRKYIILKEKYLNEWCSTTELVMTDDENIVSEFVEQFNK